MQSVPRKTATRNRQPEPQASSASSTSVDTPKPKLYQERKVRNESQHARTSSEHIARVKVTKDYTTIELQHLSKVVNTRDVVVDFDMEKSQMRATWTGPRDHDDNSDGSENENETLNTATTSSTASVDSSRKSSSQSSRSSAPSASRKR